MALKQAYADHNIILHLYEVTLVQERTLFVHLINIQQHEINVYTV